jgi:hypothetical protein
MEWQVINCVDPEEPYELVAAIGCQYIVGPPRQDSEEIAARSIE